MTYEELKQIESHLSEIGLMDALTLVETDCFSFLDMWSDLCTENDSWDETIELYKKKGGVQALAVYANSLVKWLRFIKAHVQVGPVICNLLQYELGQTITQLKAKVNNDEIIEKLIIK